MTDLLAVVVCVLYICVHVFSYFVRDSSEKAAQETVQETVQETAQETAQEPSTSLPFHLIPNPPNPLVPMGVRLALLR